jgi:hypothetical protein
LVYQLQVVVSVTANERENSDRHNHATAYIMLKKIRA